jgi:PAS domain S-box-containing protein
MNHKGKFFKSSNLLVISLVILDLVIVLISMKYYQVEKKSFLMVRMNQTEASAEIRQIRNSTVAFTVLLIVALTSLISAFWFRQHGEMLGLENDRKLISERYDLLSKFANDAIVLFTEDLIIIQTNDKALELYGYTLAEFLGMSADLLWSQKNLGEFNSRIEEVVNEGGQRFESLHQRKDGSEFPVEVSARYIDIPGNNCFQIITRDITQRKQIERALIESEERFRLITNTIPQIVWTARPGGKFDFVNSRFESLTGLFPFKENALEKSIHPGDLERVTAFWKDAVQEICEHQIQFRLRMKNGNYRWFLCIAIPLCNQVGKVISWFGSATDIDELENRVAQRTAELSDLYNYAPCGYLSMDTNGTFAKINDTALNWLGYKRDEVVGKLTFAELITGNNRKEFISDFLVFKNQGFVNNLQYDMVRKDGTVLPVLLSATAIKDNDGKIIMTRTTIIDHTERKQYENKILKLNRVLQEHGYNLEYANKELEAFSYSVSHDLRAPLRAINGFSRILLEKHKNGLDQEGQKILEMVCNNANQMRLLIDDLLRLSRTSRQELTYARIDMQALFISLIDETKQNFPDRTLALKVNSLPEAFGDLALLKQVISNLLSNAVKFSGKKEVSEIEIGSITGDVTLIFFVKDNGIGFDMKYAPELFGVFRRLHNADDYEGTGVGLALVKRIIDKHGGKVWAESEPGKGAIFSFSLPKSKES